MTIHNLNLTVATTCALLLSPGLLWSQPTLAISLVPKVSINAQPGTMSAIQYSTNLSNPDSWVTLTTVRVTQSPLDYIDVSAGASPQRYYRAMTISTNPGPIDLIWIRPGTFTMGSPSNEVGRVSDEGPQTTVTITRGFWIGRYEVTQGQFTNIMGSWGFYNPGPDLPAESLTWLEAVNYCSTLTDIERQAGRLPAGYVYRLPTEAEWEYAARAGTTSRFFYGDDPSGGLLVNYAWSYQNSIGVTRPVGQKLPNPWGLFDIYGNVSEWCLDNYATSYTGGSLIDPVGPPMGTLRNSRGGNITASGAYSPNNFRSANRTAITPGYYYSEGGLRVVLGPLL